MEFGVIFDWDGVVIDSSAAHEASWEMLAEEENKPLPEGHFKRGFGQKNAYIIPNLLQWVAEEEAAEIKRLSLRKEELYREILGETGVTILPGVRELLNALKAAEIPCVVGSSSERKNIQLSIELLSLQGYFRGMVTSEDVTLGKPNPEVFLKAAELAERKPETCVVFEDSHAGIEAGIAGGMQVIGVATTHPIETLNKATTSVLRLTEVTVDSLRALWA